LKWNKKGIIYDVSGKFSWAKSHTSVPIVDQIDNSLFRIYFTSRNLKNQSSMGFFEIDINEPKKILYETQEPILEPGKLGTFDESGVMGVSLVSHERKKYLYYVGWNQPKTIPFRWSIGLAISEDEGKSFKKFSEGPILERNTIDPYFVSSPFVIFDNMSWKMYYISGLKWNISKDGSKSIPYHIKYAESRDGINWNRKGNISIDFKYENETRIAKACVFRENKIYKMFYCYAINNYVLGYAESTDGINWIRKDDQIGITTSKSGWDSEMIEYPFFINYNNKKYLFYNGNEYGKTGIGYAILDK
jgi:predicted GH43/DUF377 family glycosyl hydrolase